MSDITENDNVSISAKDIPINIEDIMHTAYLQYSLSVNVGRAIPDVRDGLKPVNRRILFAMRQLGLSKSHSYTKSAKVVGDVIGKYHPHGDSSVYDAMVRLAQDFSMRMPLVDGQGNFGSIDGDPPAAYRYTECRMERLAEELLADIEKDTVNMTLTFDESSEEPEVLPARFPNLLVNGSTGIGVGMATNIPPHNLTEIINATVQLLDHPTSTVQDLMEHVHGPDFPTAAFICGRRSIRQLYETGHGSIKMRARAEVIEKNGKEQIIVTEIPYAVNKENLVKKIAELVHEKKITGISGLRDETSRRAGIRIVIDIKRGAMGNIVLNQLYSHTPMESTFGANMLVVDHNRPKVMNLTQILQAYIDHRLEVVTRRTRFELQKAEARAHVLEGLLIALDHMDEVVSIIRNSRTRQDAADTLTARFKLSILQTNAILDMRLHQLTGLAADDIKAEYDELVRTISYLKELLASREKRLAVIREELVQIRDKYGDTRRSEIIHDEGDLKVADLIARHSCVITVTDTGYIKRVPADTYRTQHRGGKGIIGMETKEEDFVEHLFNADSHDLIFFFTDRGFMHWLNVFEIPEGTRTSKGKAIVNMIKIEPGEKIRAMLTVDKFNIEREDLYIVMATKNGYIKKTELAAFKNLRRTGIRALIIEDDDDLIDAAISGQGNEIVLSTARGMACRFMEDDIRPMGRTARGVTGIRFKYESDYVVGMVVVEHIDDNAETLESDEEEIPESAETSAEGEENISGSGPELLVVSDGGMGKRSCVSSYRRTRRGAKGVTSIKLGEGEKVLAAIQVVADDELIITTENGIVVRIPVNEIRTIGRATRGVRIMSFKGDDRITGVAKVVRMDSESKNSSETDSEEVEEPRLEESHVIPTDVQDSDIDNGEDNDDEDDNSRG